MTFKELVNQLQKEGWRAYYIKGCSTSQSIHNFHAMAVRHLIEFQVFEGEDIIFVKTFHPPIDVQKLDKNKAND